MFIFVSPDSLPLPQGLPRGKLHHHHHHPLIVSDRMVDYVLGTVLRAHNTQRKRILLTAMVLGLLQSIDVDQTPDKRFRQGFCKNK